jgi:hypothetical protein
MPLATRSRPHDLVARGGGGRHEQVAGRVVAPGRVVRDPENRDAYRLERLGLVNAHLAPYAGQYISAE